MNDSFPSCRDLISGVFFFLTCFQLLCLIFFQEVGLSLMWPGTIADVANLLFPSTFCFRRRRRMLVVNSIRRTTSYFIAISLIFSCRQSGTYKTTPLVYRETSDELGETYLHTRPHTYRHKRTFPHVA